MEKERVSVTLTRPYLAFLARLVEDGVYLTRGGAIMAGLRLLMKEEGFVITPREAVGW